MSVLALVGAAHFTVAHFGSLGMPIMPPHSPLMHRMGWEVSVMLGWHRARVLPYRAQRQQHTCRRNTLSKANLKTEKNKRSGCEAKGKRSIIFQGGKTKARWSPHLINVLSLWPRSALLPVWCQWCCTVKPVQWCAGLGSSNIHGA